MNQVQRPDQAREERTLRRSGLLPVIELGVEEVWQPE